MAKSTEITGLRSGSQLDLDSAYRPVSSLDQDVDLASAGRSEMMDADVGLRPCSLLDELHRHEVLKQGPGERCLVFFEPDPVIVEQLAG